MSEAIKCPCCGSDNVRCVCNRCERAFTAQGSSAPCPSCASLAAERDRLAAAIKDILAMTGDDTIADISCCALELIGRMARRAEAALGKDGAK